jgi:hypothetical protein
VRPLDEKIIRKWYEQCRESSSVEKGHATGQSRRCGEEVIMLERLPNGVPRSVFQANAELQMLQTATRRILWKSQHLKPYKLQVAQKLTAYDKRRRSQFMAYMCPNFGTTNKLNKLRGFSPRVNYTNRATAACQRSKCQLFADRGCHVVSVMDPYGRILGFRDWSRYFFFQVVPQLYSRGWVDPVPDPPLRKSGSVGSRTRDLWICSQKL